MNKNYTIINEAFKAINRGEDIPKRIGDFHIVYHSTDAWRGYYEAKPTKKSGWTKIDESWVTGNWSDAGENSSDSIEERLDQLAKKVKKAGGEMAVIFLPTSNVFSTSWEAYVRGIPFKLFDNGGKTWDRYTLVVNSELFGFSENPSSPQGFNQYGGKLQLLGDSRHWGLGREVKIESVPEEVQKAIFERIL